MSESRFVQYVMLKCHRTWRFESEQARAAGREEFERVVTGAFPGLTTHAYSTVALKADCDLLLWWYCEQPETAQNTLGKLLLTGFGKHCSVSHCLFGLTRPSQYTKQRTAQEHALDAPSRLKYLVVYPFTKTIEWYLMSREARQGLMNEHMRIGHEYDDVRQVLLYATGLDDQEFVVAYETDDLERHHQLVVALRSTESRRYTLRDTPIFTAIHRPLSEALAILG